MNIHMYMYMKYQDDCRCFLKSKHSNTADQQQVRVRVIDIHHTFYLLSIHITTGSGKVFRVTHVSCRYCCESCLGNLVISIWKFGLFYVGHLRLVTILKWSEIHTCTYIHVKLCPIALQHKDSLVIFLPTCNKLYYLVQLSVIDLSKRENYLQFYRLFDTYTHVTHKCVNMCTISLFPIHAKYVL